MKKYLNLLLNFFKNAKQSVEEFINPDQQVFMAKVTQDLIAFGNEWQKAADLKKEHQRIINGIEDDIILHVNGIRKDITSHLKHYQRKRKINNLLK